MATFYELQLAKPNGTVLPSITRYARLEYSLIENDAGVLDLLLTPEIDMSLLNIDGRIKVSRKIDAYAPYIDGETTFFIRRVTWTTSEKGENTIKITAFTAAELLKRRIVAYNSESVYADKWAEADDVMKALVRENMGSLAVDTARNLTAAGFSVDADVSLGPISRNNFAYQNIFDSCKKLADASRNNGSYLCFDVVNDGESGLIFKTYFGQRGIDHTIPGMTVTASVEAGNITGPELIYDHADEHNFVYAGGTGIGQSRLITTSYDASRIGLSPYNRCEVFFDSRSTGSNPTTDIAKLQNNADAAVRYYRPKRYFSGRLLDSPGLIYGVHYNFGDIIYAKFKGVTFVSHVNAVHVVSEGGKENIDISVRGEQYV